MNAGMWVEALVYDNDDKLVAGWIEEVMFVEALVRGYRVRAGGRVYEVPPRFLEPIGGEQPAADGPLHTYGAIVIGTPDDATKAATRYGVRLLGGVEPWLNGTSAAPAISTLNALAAWRQASEDTPAWQPGELMSHSKPERLTDTRRTTTQT